MAPSQENAQARPTGAAFANAYSIAQGQVPGAQLIRARTENQGAQVVFGFYFYYQGRILEIEIAQTGKIVKNTSDDVDPVTRDIAELVETRKKSKVKLPEGRLLEIAGDAFRNNGFPDLQYQREGDRLVIRAGNLVIDAQTGRIISGN
jgi:uncharacterized membrane protein YkoI